MTLNAEERMADLLEMLCQRIEFTTTDDSLREVMRQIIPKGRERDKKNPLIGWATRQFKDNLSEFGRENNAMLWVVAMLKDYLPEIEIYVDEIARGIAIRMKKVNGEKIDEDKFIKFLMDGLSKTLVHELIHDLGIDNEIEVDDYSHMLLDAMKMVWQYIPCPNSNNLVDWKTCLSCDDSEKHETCPLQRIRQDAVPREYEPKKYHVSELLKVRYSFFERRFKTVAGWEEYWPLFWGRAIGWYVASLYDKETREFELNVNAKDLAKFYGLPAEPTDDFVITGHIDILTEADGLVLELKTQYNLKYITKDPNPHHVAQLQAYYTLGLIQFPDVFGKLKALRIVYFGRNWKGSGMPPYKEHTVPKEIADLLTPARWLRASEDTEHPPPIYCPDWMCKNCPHTEMCREEKKK